MQVYVKHKRQNNETNTCIRHEVLADIAIWMDERVLLDVHALANIAFVLCSAQCTYVFLMNVNAKTMFPIHTCLRSSCELMQPCNDKRANAIQSIHATVYMRVECPDDETRYRKMCFERK